MLTERAPAKINLTLHILGRRADGFHDLESLVAFAGCGDTLTLTPGGDLSLAVDGPTAQAAGDGDDNLVLRAARAFAERAPGATLGAFRLTKRLPVAAGLGGGSADAAAALRLLARANSMAPDDPRLHEAARSVGSDVPVCLASRARMMAGVGDDLGAGVKLPPLFAVLVNPGVALPTKDVFGKLGLSPGEATANGKHPAIRDAPEIDALLPALKRARNDLEDPAAVLQPKIVHALAAIAAARGCRLARMSGSGATCYGLFETCRSAGRAAKAMRRDHPDWWVKATALR
jgi:4-diphosphocytidyl-2-C-methyl-D-erythritol kinase